jgi:hypothetical protein
LEGRIPTRPDGSPNGGVAGDREATPYDFTGPPTETQRAHAATNRLHTPVRGEGDRRANNQSGDNDSRGTRAAQIASETRLRRESSFQEQELANQKSSLPKQHASR